MKFMVVLATVIALSLVAVAGDAAAEELWRRGELLASEDFSAGLGDWMSEGDVEARLEDGRLRFEALEETDVTKGNIWWRKRFEGPLLIEFDYRSATPFGLTMIWFNAHSRHGGELLSSKRSGRYEEYVKGEMNGYHVSFHRFDSGVSNLRKSYGFHVLSTADDPVPPEDLDEHHVSIYCRDGHIRMHVDGELVHDVKDDGSLCIEGDAWMHDYPCEGTGPVWDHGYIGIRHTQKQAAFYDNFRVYRLQAP